MKNNFKRMLCVILLLLIGISCQASMTKKHAPPQTVKRGSYIFRLAYANESMSAREAERWWGAFDDRRAQTVLSNLTGTYKGQSLFVPRSAFSGLANVSDVSAKLVKNGCVLEISGGDAAGAYDAKITFRRLDIVQRIVDSGEFSGIWYEKTIYRYPKPGELK